MFDTNEEQEHEHRLGGVSLEFPRDASANSQHACNVPLSSRNRCRDKTIQYKCERARIRVADLNESLRNTGRKPCSFAVGLRMRDEFFAQIIRSRRR